MPRQEILDRIQKYVDPFRITKGKRFRLNDFDPGDTCGLKLAKGEAADLLQRGTEWLAEEQDMLYAQDRWSLLLVFQAMDAAGKDGTIKHVMSGVNPQGCQVFSFKQPSPGGSRSRLHVALRQVPARTRAHRNLQPLVLRGGPGRARASGDPRTSEAARADVGKKIWDERLADIAHFEDYLTRQGTIILKFFLHCRARSRRSGSCSASIDRTSTGNSRPPTSASEGSGTTTCTRSRRQSGRPRRRGTLVRRAGGQQVVYTARCRSGDRGSGGEASTSPTRRSTRRRRRRLAAARAALAREK